MSNSNIEIDLLKLDGAKVQEIQGRTQIRRCVCVPIDNRVGTVTDAYFARQGDGELHEVKLKGVLLHLTAFELRSKEKGQSHLIKPSFSREMYEGMTEDQVRRVPWIGNVKPWSKPEGGSGSDW